MFLSRHAALSLLLPLLFPVFIHAQEGKRPSDAPATSADVYQDSAEGLQLLLENVLAAARNHSRPKLDAFVRQMEIPNYNEWFTKTFGQEKGGSWAGPYGRDLARNENDFQAMFMEFANQDGEIFTRSVNDTPDPGRSMESGMVDALQRPVDIFYASWKKRESPPDSKEDPIGYFIFVDGQFRWDSTITFLKIGLIDGAGNAASQGSAPEPTTLEANNSSHGGKNEGPFHPGAGGVGYPACSFCPDLEYPKQAKANHLEGTVVLQAIIQPDGRATDVKIVKTPNADFAQKEVDAVARWRFKPARDREGQPVAVIVPIEVTFRLLN